MEKLEKITVVSRKDLVVSYFVGPGKGGQNKQKNATGVQIIHRESGAIGRASDTRSLVQNKKAAFRRLAESPKMRVWLNRKIYEIQIGEGMRAKIEREVEKMMAQENLIIETF